MSEPYVGEIRLFGFSRVPNGWFACDGSLQPISQYETLFALIGTIYGGDGVSTFAVPDLRSQVPLHWGQGPGLSNYVIGQAAGSESVTLIAQQMPSHTHTMLATTLTASAVTPAATLELGGLNGDAMYVTDISGAAPFSMNPATLGGAGGSQPHDNLMPTLTVQYCIAWAGIFPQQN